MGVSDIKFMILRELASKKAPENPYHFALKEGSSESDAQHAIEDLESCGWMNEGRITSAGRMALAPYRVDNAIIMAAEFRQNFVPLSYEKPPCLFTFRGEILIERQIKQLKAAGVHNIIVVAGDKAEHLFYLEKQYGVEVVFNPEFMTRGSHSSLMTVRNRLKNSYILDSCDYFQINPFHQFERGSFCSLSFSKEESSRICVTLGSDGRITDPQPGGSNSWCVKGHVFFDRGVSKDFSHALKDAYSLPQTCRKSWIDLFVEKLNDYEVMGKAFDQDCICSLRSISQASDLDPKFLDSGDSKIFSNIVNILGCKRSEIHDIYPIDQGLTNSCFHFRTNEGEWTYRHPGIGTDHLVDYAVEYEALQVARRIGLYTSFIHEDPTTGWMISRFMPNTRKVNMRNEAHLQHAMQVARMLHSAQDTVSRQFDFFEVGRDFARRLLDVSTVYLPAFNKLSLMAQRAREIARVDEGEFVLCHNDFSETSLFLDEDGIMRLVEWDYAGMADYASDFGTMVVSCQLNEQEALKALEYYFGRPPTEGEVCHNFAYIGLAAWCWYVWSLLKEAEGDFVGDWLFVYHRYAKEYLAKAAWIAESLGID